MSKIGALRELLLALLKEHERDGAIPASGRFLFYELVQRVQYSKVATGRRRALGRTAAYSPLRNHQGLTKSDPRI